MREFYTVINEALRNGLRPYDCNFRDNTKFLTEYYNCRCGKIGHESPEVLTNPISSVDVNIVWPFPQFIKAWGFNLFILRDEILSRDQLYVVNDDYSATLKLNINWAIYGEGDRFSAAAFKDYIIMSNGDALIYFDPVSLSYSLGGALVTVPLFKTAINYNGQAIFGNIQSDWYDCDENYIVWSRIGNIDCTPRRDNTSGYMPFVYSGEVFQVLKLDNYIVVYGENGVARMTPAPKGFGLSKVKRLSIPSRYAIAGDVSTHVFVANGLLWRITSKGLEELGYSEYVEQLDQSDIVISYAENLGDFYICDGSKCFLLTSNGLSEVHYLPTSCWLDGQQYAFFKSSGDEEARIVTDVLDMGQRGDKTIFTNEVSASSSGTMQTAVDWRKNTSNEFQKTGWKTLNRNGFVRQIINGTEFKLNFKTSDYSDLSIGSLTTRWKMTDMRSLRGIYAAPPRGQS
jgi:hypothetical protein